MLNLKKLIDLLPYYYKEADTYKDKDNKGILEKYLEIFGNYFQNDIVTDIKSLQNLNDINDLNIYNVQYLWKFLGEMPFINLLQWDYDKFKIYHDNLSISLKTGNFIDGLDQDSQILKYSISLYKIRGTKKFFDILFRLYGLTCTILDHSDDIFDDSITEGSEDYGGKDEDYGGKDEDYGGLTTEEYSIGYINSRFDNEDSKLDSNYKVDRNTSCNQCRNLSFRISGFDKSILESSELHNQLLRACKGIIDRFLPLNVTSTVSLDGFSARIGISTHLYIIQDGKDGKKLKVRSVVPNLKNSYSIVDYYDEEDTDTRMADKYLYLQDGLRRSIQLYVEVVPSLIGSYMGTNYEVDNLDEYSKFTFNTYTKDAIQSNTRVYKGSSVINVNKAGNYVIVPTEASTNTLLKFDIVRKSSIKYYNIGYEPIDGILKITPDHPTVTILLTGTVSVNDTIYPAHIRRVDTGEIYNVDVEKGYTLTLDQGGSYTFELVDYPIKKVSFTIDKESEILEVTVDPEKGYISNGSTASTVLNVTGNYHKDKIMAIQAKDAQGAIISYDELETFPSDGEYFIDPPGKAFNDNMILSRGYARTSIPLWDNTYSNGKPHARVSQIRICCLANPIRKTTQYIKVRKYDYTKGSYINDLIDLSEKLTMHDGGYINSNGEIVENPNYKYSDWLDVTTYQEGTGYYGAISRLEAWLICSPLTCYEGSKKDILYNCGDKFTTDSVGSFTFIGIGDTGNGTKATFNVINKTSISVSYTLTLSSQSLSYGKDSNEVTLLVTLSTSLSFELGKKYDKELNFSFELWKYNISSTSSTWSKLKTIPITDKWIVDTNLSRYTKRYSLVLYNKNDGDNEGVGVGTFKIRSLDNSFSPKNFTVSNYVDPSVSYLYLEPDNTLDQGWVKPDWSTADIGDPSNTPADVIYDLLNGTPQFKIKVLNGDPDSLNSVNIHRVVDNTLTLVNTVNYNETISNLTQEGTYIFSVKNDSSVQTAKLTITKKVNFKITCNPAIAILSGSTVSTQVVASCDDPTISTSKLQVKLVGDSTWHDTPYTYVAHSTGIYNFTVRGNEDGDEPTTTFQVISSSSLGVSPTSLTWEGGDNSEQEVKLVGDDSLNWEISVEDVDS